MFWSLKDEKRSTGFRINKIDQEVDVSITVVSLNLDGLFEFRDWVLCLHLIKEIHEFDCLYLEAYYKVCEVLRDLYLDKVKFWKIQNYEMK
jgi:hypothetical protein